MKYAFFIFFFLFNLAVASAAQIDSFYDSPALMNISQFMEDSGGDMKVGSRISDKKLKLPDTFKCTQTTKKDIVKAFEKAVQNVLRFYPDEELPIDEALADLESYIGSSTFMKCDVLKRGAGKIISSQYFFDSTDHKHIKVDTITLLPE